MVSTQKKNKEPHATLAFTHFVSAALKTTFLAATALLALSSPLPSYASEAPDTCLVAMDSIEVKVLFPVGKSEIALSYQRNDERLARFLERLREANADPAASLSRICIGGYASPEGGYLLNQRLAQRRAENLAAHIRSRIDIPDSLIVTEGNGINWQGLDRAVGESSLANKARVQEIIRQEPEVSRNARGTLVSSRAQKLKSLDGGRTWGWMMRNLYPSLRSSGSVVCYIKKRHEEEPTVPETEPADTMLPTDGQTAESLLAETEQAETIKAGASVPPLAVKTPRYPVLALRGNLLLPLLNVGVEAPLGNRWSVGADYYYPWAWRKTDHKDCFQLTFFSGEARYWFGAKHTPERDNRLNRLLGHSIAAYGAWGYYDFERDYHGHQGDFWSAGLDYAYAAPLFRKRLHLEFQIAAGFIHSKAQPYDVFMVGGDPIRDRQTKKNVSYIGPTKIGISLVLPIKARIR